MTKAQDKWIEKPVCVTGLMKSGTTLLLNLLDGHPDLRVLHDEISFHWLFSRVYSNRQEMVNNWLYATTSNVLFHKAAIAASDIAKDFDIQGYKALQGELKFDDKQLDQWFSQSLSSKEHKIFDIKKFYSSLTKELGSGKIKSARDVANATVRNYNLAYNDDKQPKAWAYKNVYDLLSIQNISSFISMYPDSKTVVILRDPRGFWQSRVKWRNTTQGKHAQGFKNYLRDIALLYYNHLLMTQLQEQEKDNIFFIHYERLVNNAESEMTKLCNFLGVAYHTILQNPTKMGIKTTVSTATTDGGDMIYQSSDDSWKKRNRFERLLIEILTEDYISNNNDVYNFTCPYIIRKLFRLPVRSFAALLVGMFFDYSAHNYYK